MRKADAAHQAAKDELEKMGQALENAVHMVAEMTAVQPEGKQDAATQAQQRFPSDENRRAAQQPTPALRTSTPAQRTNGGLLGTSQPHPNVTDRGAKKPRRLQPIVGADGVVHWRPGGRGDFATPITPGRRRVENAIDSRARAVQEARRLLEEEDGVSHEVQAAKHRTPMSRRVRWADDLASGGRGQSTMSPHAGGAVDGPPPRDRNLQAIVTDSKTERAIVQYLYNPYNWNNTFTVSERFKVVMAVRGS